MDYSLIAFLLNEPAPSIGFSLYLLYRLELINYKINAMDKRLDSVEYANSKRSTLSIPIGKKNRQAR